MTRKVQRPKAWDPKKLKFPVWVQPKIDGVRGYNPEGTLLARTQKLHRNLHITEQFSKPEYIGFDGEFAAADERDPALCRLTSSAMSTIEGQPFVLWHVFDYVVPGTIELPYSERYAAMLQRIVYHQALGLCGHLRAVPYIECVNLEQVELAHSYYMELGYEGSCIYNPRLPHKEGDSSAHHGGVNRIKDFVDIEGRIMSLEEADENNNEAQINELGRTYRTSHQENKVPNGMLAAFNCESMTDVYDEHTKTLLIPKGCSFKMSAGALTHPERAEAIRHPERYLNKIAKGKFFPKGVKDKPRFAQFQSLRSSEDL